MQSKPFESTGGTANHSPKTAPLWPERAWLDERSSKTTLLIWDSERTRISEPETLELDVPLPDGSRLTDPLNADWFELLRAYVYLLRDDTSVSINTARAHILTVKRLLIFLCWVRLQGIFDLGRLTLAHMEKFASEISFGAGHALRYVERIKAFLRTAKGEPPLIQDQKYAGRTTLDVEGICTAIHIPMQGLASDKAASQLLARLAARRGSRDTRSKKATKGPLPQPRPVTSATHRRFLISIGYLHKWSDELQGRGLTFLPFPASTTKRGSRRTQATGHTANIPPLEAMQLLDESLRWALHHGHRILELFDCTEQFYLSECKRADSLDRWRSSEAQLSLQVAFKEFLQREDVAGVLPHGSHKVIRSETARGYDVARRVLAGPHTYRSRAIAQKWLGVDANLDDAALICEARKNLSARIQWSGTWPYSAPQLSDLIGVAPANLIRFLNGALDLDVRSLERIETFLLERHAIVHPLQPTPANAASYRVDRGIEPNLSEFIRTHPLNQPDGSDGPWPLNWNVTGSSRLGGISLYDAIRICIPSACMTVVGVFHARRESELKSLRDNCFSIEDGAPWLESHIAKTLRRDKKLPTVNTIEHVIGLLKRWSERGRSQSGSDLLFSYWTPLGSAISSTKPNQDLNTFAELTLERPMSLRLQIRQFRRFFAVTYIWRYRLGSLPTLSQYLCHSRVSMTREYVTERVGTKILREAQGEFSKELLLKAATGSIKLQGSFGRTWHRWAEKVRTKLRASIEFVGSPEKADKAFIEHIQEGVRLLTPQPGGVCAAGDRERDNRRAMCRAPDPSSPGRHVKRPELARPGQCAVCPFSATDQVHLDYWTSITADARSAAESQTPSLVRDRARIDLPRLERVVILLRSSE